jgi:hypothetical protein
MPKYKACGLEADLELPNEIHAHTHTRSSSHTQYFFVRLLSEKIPSLLEITFHFTPLLWLITIIPHSVLITFADANRGWWAGGRKRRNIKLRAEINKLKWMRGFPNWFQLLKCVRARVAIKRRASFRHSSSALFQINKSPSRFSLKMRELFVIKTKPYNSTVSRLIRADILLVCFILALLPLCLTKHSNLLHKFPIRWFLT